MVRAATPADTRAIAEVQTRAWWRAYQDILDGATLARQDVDAREERWREQVGGGTVLVAEVAGRVVGFAMHGPSRESEDDEDEGELRALYVDPPAQAAGVGSALLDAAVAAMREAGRRRAVLTVFAANDHARHFYERRGWAWDGRPPTVEWVAPIVRYRRDLMP